MLGGKSWDGRCALMGGEWYQGTAISWVLIFGLVFVRQKSLSSLNLQASIIMWHTKPKSISSWGENFCRFSCKDYSWPWGIILLRFQFWPSVWSPWLDCPVTMHRKKDPLCYWLPQHVQKQVPWIQIISGYMPCIWQHWEYYHENPVCCGAVCGPAHSEEADHSLPSLCDVHVLLHVCIIGHSNPACSLIPITCPVFSLVHCTPSTVSYSLYNYVYIIYFSAFWVLACASSFTCSMAISSGSKTLLDPPAPSTSAGQVHYQKLPENISTTCQ